MKIIKFIPKLIGGLVALSVVVGIIAFNWDAIEFQYNKLFWEPNATTAGGVSLGDSRSDVIFKKGLPDVDITAVGLIIYKMEYSDQNELEIKFTEDGIVEGIYNHRSLEIPFDTVEEMKEILGEEDVFVTTEDLVTRRYIYLEWNVSYNFEQESLTVYILASFDSSGYAILEI